MKITDERIADMLETTKDSDYNYKDFYISTLELWQDGDFSNAVKVHNTIWNSKDGIVGEAYDLMTEKEEKGLLESSTSLLAPNLKNTPVFSADNMKNPHC